jgi:hypothetical protein
MDWESATKDSDTEVIFVNSLLQKKISQNAYNMNKTNEKLDWTSFSVTKIYLRRKAGTKSSLIS